MKPWMAFLSTVALAASVTALAQDSTDAGIGTWTLNVAKSKFEPGPALKSETRSYEMTPDGLRMTSHVEMADGQSHVESTTYKFDGKSYPVSNNPNIDAVKVSRVSSREVRATQMRDGKVIGHLTRVVSKDGKMLTMTSDATTASGQKQHEVRVYDRQ
jgi:hypothetical protein